MTDQFDDFWRAYPRRVAKGAARLAFAKALRKTTLETMLKALESYIRHKPEQIDYCHPATWLNAERWEDEWETPETVKAAPVVRTARSLDELKAFYRSIGKPVTAEIERARTVEELPSFAKMIPAGWPNVVPMKRSA